MIEVEHAETEETEPLWRPDEALKRRLLQLMISEGHGNRSISIYDFKRFTTTTQFRDKRNVYRSIIP
jgi:hypothetical protein